MAATSTDARSQGSPGLRRGAIGLREVLFQSITDMAPGAAIAASIPAGAALAGGALIPPLVLLKLGFTTATTIHAEAGGYPANLWWPWSILGALIVLAAGYFGIRTSARLGTVLGVFEIGVFLVLGIFLVVHAGSHNTAEVFGTKFTPNGFRGLSGVIGGSVYTVLAFGGFEGAAPLAEQARDPRRTVQRAVLGATLSIGILGLVHLDSDVGTLPVRTSQGESA